MSRQAAQDQSYYFIDMIPGNFDSGEDMTDHVGDVISLFEVSDGGLTLLDEKVEAL